MRDMSREMQELLPFSHRLSVAVQVLRAGQDAGSLTGMVLEGEVPVGRAGRSCVLRLSRGPEDRLTVAEVAALVDPTLGVDVRPLRGVLHADGRAEQVPLGLFQVEDVRQAGASSVTVTGYDYSVAIRNAKVELAVQIPNNTNLVTATQTMLTGRAPGLVFDLPAMSETVPSLLFDETADMWEEAQKLWEAVGWYLYFRQETLVPTLSAKQEPYLGGVGPDWVYRQGTASMLKDSEQRIDTTNAKNRWIVTGGQPADGGAAPRAIVTDTTSKMAYGGTKGQRPDFVTSSSSKTAAECEKVGMTLRAKQLGKYESAKLTCFPVVPGHEFQDVVEVTDLRKGIEAQLHVLEDFTIPIGRGDLVASTRRLVAAS